MEKAIHILLAGGDTSSQAEFEAALSSVPNRRFVTSRARDLKQAEEVALTRRPTLICVDVDLGLKAVTEFTRHVSPAVPEARIVVMYRPAVFAGSDVESSFLIEALRSGAHDFLRRPVSSTELRDLLDRLFVTRRMSGGRAGKVIAFISNKGGVGKSTLSVNTASLLAQRHPDDVLLIDAALQLGVCAMLLDLLPSTTILDAVRERERLDETLLRRLCVRHDSGLHLLAAPVDAAEAAEVDDDSLSRIINLARRSFTYTVVDTFPMLDSTLMTILDVSTIVLIVMQGTAPNVVGAARLLPVLNNLSVPAERQRLILNYNYKRFAGDLTAGDIEGRLKKRVDFVFPYQKKILVSMNTGVPYALTGIRSFGFNAELAELADAIESFELEQPEADPQSAPAAAVAAKS